MTTQVTDPEALASAADRLLETVLSTPGIVEEYGDPRFGEFFVATSADHDLQDYALRIDGPLLANQRQLLLKVFDTVFRGDPYVAESPKDEELLQGVIALLDEIADQAHDRHGLASLLEADDSEEPKNPGPHNQYRCECELPGFFCSGVPGILAHMEERPVGGRFGRRTLRPLLSLSLRCRSPRETPGAWPCTAVSRGLWRRSCLAGKSGPLSRAIAYSACRPLRLSSTSPPSAASFPLTENHHARSQGRRVGPSARVGPRAVHFEKRQRRLFLHVSRLEKPVFAN